MPRDSRGRFQRPPVQRDAGGRVRPETLDSCRVGIKSEWLDRRLRVNIAAFHSDYKDVPVLIAAVDPTGLPFWEPVNLGRTRITGGEIELEAEPIARLTVSASYGLNHITVTELGAAIDCAAVDNPVRLRPRTRLHIRRTHTRQSASFVPEKTASAAILYEFRLPARGSITPAAHLAYRRRYLPMSSRSPRPIFLRERWWTVASRGNPRLRRGRSHFPAPTSPTRNTSSTSAT